VRMPLGGIRRQRIQAGARVVVSRQQDVLRAVVARDLEHFIAKYVLIERGVRIRVARQH